MNLRRGVEGSGGGPVVNISANNLNIPSLITAKIFIGDLYKKMKNRQKWGHGVRENFYSKALEGILMIILSSNWRNYNTKMSAHEPRLMLAQQLNILVY